MRILKSLFILCLVGMSCSALSQQSGITGSVIEDVTTESLIGVRVKVVNQKKGAYTDINGHFDIPLPPGSYQLKLTFIGFDTLIIKDIQVISDKKSILGNLKMHPDVSDFDEVVITEQRKLDTENAMLSLKQKSTHMIDAVSSAKFRKTGDANASDAMKRVPGVSLVDGKYIFVRGLGDRYSKTLVNGLAVPGLDPDRNTIQMDLFPTSVIKNIIVSKSFSADLPADFTGGLVEVNLNTSPREKKRTISISTAYNPNYHFNKNYLTYEKGSSDALGFGNSTREIPAKNNIPFFADAVSNPNGREAQRYKNILASFDPHLAAFKKTSMMDVGVTASVGDKFKKKDYSIGYNVSISYKNKTRFYEDAVFARYGLDSDPSKTEMEAREYQKGDFGENSVLINGMAGLSLQTNHSIVHLTVLHLQNGTSKAGIFDYTNSDQGASFKGFQHNLQYNQRSLTNVVLKGKNSGLPNDWEMDWAGATSFSSMNDPDIRFTRYEVRDNENYSISSESGFPERIWRDLQEINASVKVNAAKKLKLFKNEAKIKIGAIQNYKKRTFSIRSFSINVRDVELSGDPNELFAEKNLWPYNGNISKGTTFDTPFMPVNPNKFESSVLSTGGYVLTTLNPVYRFKVTIGLRSEYYAQRYTGQDQLGTNVLQNEKVLEDLSFFPSVNMVYKLTEKQNIRLSYGKTIARPSFKELSYSEIVDPITGRTFIGGLFRDANDVLGVEYWDGNLRSTAIHNFDLRYELFHKLGQTVSVSGFYKYFKNPIEIIQFASQAGAFQPRNVGDAQVLGAEFEIRQGLGFVNKSLNNLSLVGNLTLSNSRVQLNKTEYDSRKENARQGEVIKEYRDMAGQAPWVVNGGFSYTGTDSGIMNNLTAGLYYNVQGQTLQFAGIADRPDIYTVPFHSLNFNANKQFGKNEKYQIGIKVSNLLNSKRETVYKSYQAENQTFSSLKIGTTIRLNFRINF